MEMNVSRSIKAFHSNSAFKLPIQFFTFFSISESQSIALQEKSISSNSNLLYLFKFAWINSLLKYESI